MESRLGRACEGLTEACWLLALALAPLFFNTYSARVFEPDKAVLVRLLALVALAAWLTRIFADTELAAERARLRALGPLALPVAAFLSIQLLSTLLSVVPRASWLGSYERAQGLSTTLAFLVLFAAVATHVRGRAQAERLITAVILTSWPVALHGLLQHFHRDPLPWDVDTAYRIRGSLGNPIFLAAYLTLPALLCLGRLSRALRGADMLRALGYGLVLGVDLAAIYFSYSRGPWLGLLAGAAFLALFGIALGRRARRALVLSWITATAVCGALLLAYNLPQDERMRATMRLGRIAEELLGRTGPTGARILLWDGALEAIRHPVPLENPDGSSAPARALRRLVGYGPESQRVVLPRSCSPALARIEGDARLPDRAHSEIFDSLVTTGLLGLAIRLSLWVAVFLCGLEWLGLLGSRRRRILALALVTGGGAAGALALALLSGELPLSGPGLAGGMLLGLATFVVFSVFDPAPPSAGVEAWRRATGACLFAAILAHFVEIQFGIGTVSTLLHFWVLLGLSLAVARADARRGEEADAGRFFSPLAGAVLVCVLLATLGYDFITPVLRAESPWELLARAVSPALLGAVLVTWLVTGGLACLEQTRARSAFPWRPLAITLGVSLAGGALAWLLIALSASGIAVPGASLLALAERMGHPLRAFLGCMAILLAGSAAGLTSSSGIAPAPRRIRTGAIALLSLLVVGITARIELRHLDADAVSKAARQVPARGPDGSEPARRLHERAVELAPGEDRYRLLLGRALHELAARESDPARREALFQEAESALLEAERLGPLDSEHASDLARLESERALLASDPELRELHARRADDFFARAVTASPSDPRLHDAWARLREALERIAGEAEHDGAVPPRENH